MAWFQNWVTQLNTHAVTLNIPPGDLTQAAADRDFVIAVNDGCNNSRAYAEECTAYREIIINAPLNTPPGSVPTLPPVIVAPLGGLAAIQARTRKKADQHKAHNNYTLAIGQSLNIVGAEEAPADVAIDSGRALGASQVELDLFLAGFGTVAVFSRRGGGNWEQIGISNQEIYVDNRAPLAAGQPENREFRVQAYVNNLLTGPVSDIVVVVTIP